MDPEPPARTYLKVSIRFNQIRVLRQKSFVDPSRNPSTNNQSSTPIFGRKGNKYVQQGVGGWDKESEAAASRERVRESRADPDL